MKKDQANNDGGNISRFMDLLFEEKPDNLYVLIWTLRDKASKWFKDLSRAKKFVELRHKEDTYIGCGLSPKVYGSKKRCKAEQVAGIPGFWLDLDFAGPAHEGKKYPPDEEATRKLLFGHGWDPSLIVHSGYGLHAWWLFKEPWIFEDKKEREDAGETSRRLAYTVAERAGKRGYQLDSVFDLAWVLRIPGIHNCKKDTPVEARILSHHADRRYNPDDLKEFLLEVPAPKAKDPEAVKIEEFTLVPHAEPPFDLFAAIMDVDPMFRATWERRREDLPSASEYDFALTVRALDAGWSHQDVANLIISWRRKHQEEPEKPFKNKNYIPGTIANALEKLQGEKSQEELEIEVGAAKQEKKAVLPEERKQKLLEIISSRLGIRVLHLVKYEEDPPQYKLYTERGNVFLGGVETVTEMRPFRQKLFAETRHLIPRLKNDKWDHIAAAMGQLWESIPVAKESKVCSRIGMFLSDYLTGTPEFEPDQGCPCGNPIKSGGYWWINLDAFLKFCKTIKDEKTNAKSMARHLQELGCKNKELYYTLDERKCKRWYWRVRKFNKFNRITGRTGKLKIKNKKIFNFAGYVVISNNNKYL